MVIVFGRQLSVMHCFLFEAMSKVRTQRVLFGNWISTVWRPGSSSYNWTVGLVRSGPVRGGCPSMSSG
jgi:hypothetical protein